MTACMLCRGPATLAGLCAGCLAESPALTCPTCRCGLPTATRAGQLCGRCLASPPPFSSIQAAYAYCYPLDHLLTAYKYRRQLQREATLVALWRQHPPRGHVDAMVPMPLHWRRQLWRGFNQSARLAQALMHQTGIPLLPALVRTAAGKDQHALNARQRAANLQGAFLCRRPVTGLRLALVDDVVTTTASARAASTCLLAAGAADVQIWSLFRTL